MSADHGHGVVVTKTGDANYPGDGATPEQVLRLADEFRAAANTLMGSCRRGEPLSQSPFRLTALQAPELYLNAVLLSRGHSTAEVRGLQHDLARRSELLSDGTLGLRARTAAHVAALGVEREYLVARYCAERRAPPPPNWLAATLEDVARKCRAAVAAGRDPSSRSRVAVADHRYDADAPDPPPARSGRVAAAN